MYLLISFNRIWLRENPPYIEPECFFGNFLRIFTHELFLLYVQLVVRVKLVILLVVKINRNSLQTLIDLWWFFKQLTPVMDQSKYYSLVGLFTLLDFEIYKLVSYWETVCVRMKRTIWWGLTCHLKLNQVLNYLFCNYLPWQHNSCYCWTVKSGPGNSGQ